MKGSRGRPPLDEDDPSVPVHVKLPSKVFDAMRLRAQQNRITVQEEIRRAMRNATAEEKRGP
jgi:hypothetical protein